jgi:flavin-dependent dehydrogenase
MHSDTHYDVIIVGGRPAGATLAARLGQQGLQVLLLERAVFPRPPAASCPAIYPSAMALLDEIGAEESDYARGTPPIRRMLSEVRDDFRIAVPVMELWGRDYCYAIDRARFDDALWRTAAASPGVTACQGFAVTGLLWQGERVVGVRGRQAGGPEVSLRAGCVVGADGRFSGVARAVDAQVYDQRTDLPTTLYYAYWRGAEPFDSNGPALHSVATGRGYGYLLMDSADDSVCVAVGGQSALVDPGAEDVTAYYLRLLREQPRVWRRVAQAVRITDVRGMRNIGNLYRAAGGPGWALVGDALHQKDPLDGQGIYDAMLTAKLLSMALVDWKRGTLSWEQAIAAYELAARAATQPMYKATLERVRHEIYTTRPDWAYKTWLRWLATDPEYGRRLGLLLGRGIDPERWLPMPVFLSALACGALGDLGRLALNHFTAWGGVGAS